MYYVFYIISVTITKIVLDMYQYLFYIIIFLGSFSQASLTITGVPDHIEKNISQRLAYKIRPLQYSYNEQLSDQLIRETTEAIKPYGYFNPSIKVSAPSEDPSDITLSIVLNELTHIKKIKAQYTTESVDPNLKVALSEVLSSFESTAFSLDTLSEMKKSLQAAAYHAGYYDILISRGDTEVNRYTNLAKITFLITPKDMNRFGEIIYPESCPSQCFARYHTIRPMEKFDEEKVHLFQKNMMRSGLFSHSSIITVPRDVNPSIQDLMVNYTYSAPVKYFLGFGLRSNIGDKQLVPQAQGTMNFQIGHCGTKLAQSFKYAKDTFILDSQLIFPSLKTIHHFSSVSFRFNNNSIREEDSSKYFQASALSQFNYRYFQHRLSLNLLIEESTLNQNNTYISNLLYPEYKFRVNYLDTKGSLILKLKLRAGLAALGSEFNFAQSTASTNIRANVGYMALNSHLVVGKIWSDNFPRFPLSMQYYMGGANSHRGYKYHEINEGSRLFLARNSLQLKLPHDLYLGGFFDTGYCTNNDDRNLTHASGPLLSWNPKFGRFELSIGRRQNESNWVVLFNVEPGEDLL